MPNELIVVIIALLGALVVQIPTLVSNFALWNKSNVNARDIAANLAASKGTVEVGNSQLVLQNANMVPDLVKKMSDLQTRENADLLREMQRDKDMAALQGEKSQLVDLLKSVQASLDTANAKIVEMQVAQDATLAELVIVKAQLKEANDQISSLRDELNIARNPDDHVGNADKNTAMKERDDASALTAVPEGKSATPSGSAAPSAVVADDLHVRIVGTSSVTSETAPIPPETVEAKGNDS